MSPAATLEWTQSRLQPVTTAHGDIEVADSWLAIDGTVRALPLHRERFLAAAGTLRDDAEEFFDAAIAALPTSGEWFPRVDARSTDEGTSFFLHIRPAPVRTQSLAVMNLGSPDPRIRPTVKGPSLERLQALRADAKAAHGVDDVIIQDADGHVVEGASTALVWWRGDMLCVTSQDVERVASVTERSVLALATALGTTIYWESVRPDDLDGCEVWALNALHGARIVTAWLNSDGTHGPAMAEEPGRLQQWQTRLEALRKPIGTVTQTA